jgi:branched-chain amino acid transport system permease protein
VGPISFGQQAYLGIGAYALYLLGRAGISPFAAIPLAALAAAVAAAGIFLILRRLSGGYFAVASWVVAECLFLYVTTQGWLGGGTGVGLQQLSSMVPVVREADTYWTALAVLVVCAGGGYLLVRSRFGLDSRATGGEPVTAAAVGVEAQRARRLAYVLAAAGFGRSARCSSSAACTSTRPRRSASTTARTCCSWWSSAGSARSRGR